MIADGRRFVQSAIARGEHYDLIQNKINEPWHAGSSNLFTEEFFAEEKELLRPGGYLSTDPLDLPPPTAPSTPLVSLADTRTAIVCSKNWKGTSPPH